MRSFVPLVLLLVAPALVETALVQPASAQTAKHPPSHPAHAAAKPGPKLIGKFDDWQAATYQEGGQTVCYALTHASPAGALSGRGQVVLTVTQRPTGRDAVAISAGYAYPANAAVTLQVDQASLDFYTAQRSAFARDGPAVVEAFGKGKQAVAKGPGPRSGTITDSFSLRGFEAAYAAIAKACPPK